MLTESRSAFLLLRNDPCLTRANENLRVYASFLRRRSPGIWMLRLIDATARTVS